MTDATIDPPAGSATGAPAAEVAGGRTGLRHVPALDGLRGLAVAAVLLNHAGKLTGGWLGVDLFFALSGYLITTLLLAEHGRSDDGRIQLKRFWGRRVRRLGPALIVTLVLVGCYSQFVANPIERTGIRWDGLATLFEVANWRNILTGGSYWTSTLPPSPLNHTWSLSIEEQLYLLWPLAIVGVLAWKGRPLAVAVVAGVGALASAAAMVGLQAAGAMNITLYESTPTRASSLLLGACLAALRMHLGSTRWRGMRRVRVGLGFAAAVPLGFLWWWLDGSGDLPYRGVLPAAGLLATLVVAGVADANRGGPMGRVLALPPLRWLGRISYGLYLYHWPIFLWLQRSGPELSGWAFAAVGSAISIAVASVSLMVLEDPIRHGALADRQARAATVGGAAFGVLAILVGTLGAQPVPQASDWDAYLVRTSKLDAPTVVFAGDSVPVMITNELIPEVDALGVNLASVSRLECHPLSPRGPQRGLEGDIRTDLPDCRVGGRIRTEIAAYRPTVTIVLFGEFPTEEFKIDGEWRRQCDPIYDAAYREQVEQLVLDVTSTGGTVALASTPGTSEGWILDHLPAGLDERLVCRNRIIEDIATSTPGARYIDLNAYICPEPDDCRRTIDGVNLRPDGLHFAGDGARLIGAWLIDQALGR